MKNYDHKKIEQKWQKEWEKKKIYKTLDTSKKKKMYVLDMFPYPSGEGLHVGHPRGYIATDVYSRMKRMQGYNVLHPMGWDAFGLPAENFAIKNKVHPRVAVEKNIKRFKEQLTILGPDYDWSREINTTDPEYYKWTQWTFLEMYKNGLAYESYEPINWCPVDKTGLANEDVEVDGTCERCGAKVEKRPMRQWVLKITAYADRMIADLSKLSKWPEGVKEAQRNWIGREEKNGKVTYRMRDWVFSRQRYWGEPIPIIHCESCGVVPVPEKDLPVLLPKVKNYEPTDTGESPLALIKDWLNTKCPKCKAPAKRETNTMPQWAGSSWYYLRYIDPKNKKNLVDPKKEKEWMPVDVYVGGDHATRHLIYVRFWHKFLYDIGAVRSDEPFPRLEFLGYILAEDGKKFSKRSGNGISPDVVVNQFGADAFRLYEMFIGPFENTAPWSTDGMVGTRRFVERVCKLRVQNGGVQSKNIEKSLHRAIEKITADIENFKFNTAVSQFMILLNNFEKETMVTEKTFKIFLQLLAPFAPHVTEELWRELGEKKSIHLSSWPKADPKLLVEDEMKIVVQVNGKLRGEIIVGGNVSEDEIKELALSNDKVKRALTGKAPQKIIYVKGRLINIVF